MGSSGPDDSLGREHRHVVLRNERTDNIARRHPRFAELDGLRGIAALAVVISHFTGAFNSHYPHEPKAAFDFPEGAFGVQLFFMISGFVILMSVTRVRRARDFVISRFSRLYPTYWASLILAVILMRSTDFPAAHVTPENIALNTTMVQRWFLVPNIVEVYWTLAIEMQFYFIMFGLLVLSRCRVTNKMVYILATVWTIVSWVVALSVFPYTRGIDPQLVYTPVKVILNVTLAEYGPLFLAGMLFYLARNNRTLFPWALASSFSAVAIAFLLHDVKYGLCVSVVVALFAVTVYRDETRLLRTKPVAWLGKVSYSLYLVHSILGYVVIRYGMEYFGRNGAMVVALVLSLVVSAIFYQLFEVRASGALRRVLSKTLSKTAPTKA